MDLAEHEEIANGAGAPAADDASSPAVERDPPRAERTASAEKPKGLRDQLRAAATEHRVPTQPRSRDEAGKFAAVATDTAQPKVDGGKDTSRSTVATASDEGKPPAQPAATPEASSVEAPASLSKEIRAKWASVSPDLRNEIVRLEKAGADGARKLQDELRPYKETLAPYRPLLEQRGLSEAQAINQLFAWHNALAGPQKVQAAQALLRSHNIDLASLAAPQEGAPQGGQDQTAPHPLVQQLASRMDSHEQTLQRQRAAETTAAIAAFAKDRPHFDRVQLLMGHLIKGGSATDMADAYDKAVWADPTVRADIQREGEEKRAAEAAEAERKRLKDAADAEAERKRKDADELAKARRAGVSPRGSAPVGAMPIAKGQQGKSVRSTIADAVRQSSGAI